MDREDTHEQRIKEVKEALAALHQLQSELARRDASMELAVLRSPSTAIVVDERRTSSRGSGLGSCVVALLILTAAAAGLVSAGQTDVATWARQQWAEGVRKITKAYMPAVASVADHLPVISALTAQRERPATPRDDATTRHTATETDASSAAQKPGPRERTASLPHDTPADDDGATTGPPPELGDDRSRHSQPKQDLHPADGPPARQQHPPAMPAHVAPMIPPADTRVVVLREARRLLEANEIEAARQKLRAHSPEQHADIAWALARTYDPLHIRSVGADAAAGDVQEAEKWYRRWYTIGVESGLVSRSFRIDRLIEAMRRQ
jgi:hypothetical protein